MDKFNNKYRIPSARLQNWDYASAGAYFITICTKGRKHYFGECINDKMQMSTIGLIVQGCWFDIPNHTSTNIILGEFVVMPNHIHGIIILGESKNKTTVETLHATSSDKGTNKNEIPDNATPSDKGVFKNEISDNATSSDKGTNKNEIPDNATSLDKGTNKNKIPDNATSLNKGTNKNEIPDDKPLRGNDFFGQISPKPGSASRIIGSFKSACTKHINLAFPNENFDWQERFWDNIIMNEGSFERISDYIINNPKKWKEDKFFEQCN